MRALHRWLSLPNDDRLLIVQVALIMVLIRVGLRFLPVKTTKRLLAWNEKHLRAPATTEPAYKDRVVRAVSAVARRMLGDGTCLTQALATQLLLRRRGFQANLCIGVAKDNSGQVVAHAWVENDDMVVIGGPKQELERYTRLPALERGWQ